MSDPSLPSHQPFDASTDAFEPLAISSSDPVLGEPMLGEPMLGSPVLGYPATEPPGIDLGPVPSGVGAKPSGKSPATDTAGKPSQKRPSPKRTSQNKPEARTGPPLPKRPKGRLFIGSIFLLVMTGLALTGFNTLLRYTAYGEVVGRRIELAVPWPGVVQSIHVREGETVRFGDLIARIDNLELRQKIEEIDDSLRLQRAQLSSDLAMLRWEAEKIRDLRKLSQSEFYDKWSELLWEQSKLTDLRTQLGRLESIHREGAASEEQLLSLRFQYAGQEKRAEQLTEAVRALKTRADESPIELDLEDRVRPTLARIENLQAELQRTRQVIRQGEIRAPAGGRIVRTNRFTGEYAEPSTPLVELLIEGSTEMVIYIPQSEAESFPVGRVVTINVNPSNTNVSCRIDRVALQMRKAPTSLARYYQVDETLLPVYLRVTDRDSVPKWLALGSELRLPRADNTSVVSRWRQWWQSDSPEQIDPLTPPSQSIEQVRPVRTASEQDGTPSDADDALEADGRTAKLVQPDVKVDLERGKIEWMRNRYEPASHR